MNCHKQEELGTCHTHLPEKSDLASLNRGADLPEKSDLASLFQIYPGSGDDSIILVFRILDAWILDLDRSKTWFKLILGSCLMSQVVSVVSRICIPTEQDSDKTTT